MTGLERATRSAVVARHRVGAFPYALSARLILNYDNELRIFQRPGGIKN
jgi:hypothetical protein